MHHSLKNTTNQFIDPRSPTLCDFAHILSVWRARVPLYQSHIIKIPNQDHIHQVMNLIQIHRLINRHNFIYLYIYIQFNMSTTTHDQPNGNHNTCTTARTSYVRRQDNTSTITTISIYINTDSINTIISNQNMTVMTN